MKSMVTHLSELSKMVMTLDSPDLKCILTSLEICYEKNQSVFIFGNGGSATIAEHFATDWSKGIFQATGKSLKTFSLNSNLGVLTAISNDVSFEESLSFLLPQFIGPGDVVFLISSSGASPNIVKAAQVARSLGVQVLSLSGFGRSRLSELSDFCLSVDSRDYQLIEDLHAIVGHLVLKHFQEKYGINEKH
jgi:D-sedoheptulose 7-phosphate isomerase